MTRFFLAPALRPGSEKALTTEDTGDTGVCRRDVGRLGLR